MFAWRKKPDGFEWHKYVRTTVKLRRDARRERVHAARRAAGENAQAAGEALIAGSRAAGSAARDGAVAGAGAVGLGLLTVWSVIAHFLQAAGKSLYAALSRPNIGGPVVLAGAFVLGAGIGRYRAAGLDGESISTLVAGCVLLCAVVPLLAQFASWRLPRLPGLSALSGKGIAVVTAIAVLVCSGIWLAGAGGVGGIASMASLPLIGGGRTVKGRAYPANADTLRVSGTSVRLAGVEAPEAEQRCGSGGRAWRCGAAAESALTRLISGRSITCTLSGKDEAGRNLGQCTVGDKDLGAELVRQGHVFSDDSLFARYASQEREARTAKAGVWASGEAERPAAYRARIWEEAKRRAPDGCPIKGQVSAGSRYYVLPWAPDYDRVRVQRGRGERWFCSEQEAVSAGFKAAHRG